MLPVRGSEDILVDFEEFRPIAAVALRQYAHRHHQKGRWLLADKLNVPVKTADGYLSGRDPIPSEHLVTLPDILGFDFTCFLFDAMDRAGKRSVLKRIVHAHIKDIARHAHGKPSCRRFDSLVGSVDGGGGSGRLGVV